MEFIDRFVNHEIINRQNSFMIVKSIKNTQAKQICILYTSSASKISIISSMYPSIKLFIYVVNNKLFVLKNGLHHHVHNTAYWFCTKCKEYFEDGEELHTVDGDTWCEDCYNENWCECSECGNEIEIDDSNSTPNGEALCSGCYNENYFICHSCNETHAIDDSGISPTGNRICQTCFDDSCSFCSNCDEVHWNDDLTYCDASDTYLCSDCYDESATIHNYDYKPMPIFNKLDTEISPLFIGFELEVECGDKDANEVAEDIIEWMTQANIDKYYYIKRDGSLNNGFEIVTHPFTKNYFKNLKIYELLKYLSHKGLKSHDSGTCGLHFHMSRDHFNSAEQLKLKTFYSLNTKKILKISRRKDAENLRQWAEVEQYMPRNIIKNRGLDDQDGRYKAVNITRKTIEIRIFRGTLKYESFKASYLFVLAVADFIKQFSAVVYFNGLCWKRFVEFVKLNKEYRTFYTYLVKEKMHLASTNVSYGVMSPAKIAKLNHKMEVVCA